MIFKKIHVITRAYMVLKVILKLVFLNFRDQITVFLDDNKALMRRMYGNLVTPSIDLPEMPKTPGNYFFFVKSKS